MADDSIEVTRQSYFSSTSAPGNAALTDESGSFLNDPMMKMKWYHPFLTRHSAECMLIDNAPEGSYLLRPSANGDRNEYSLSVKYSHSVQHMKIRRLPDDRYQFGRSFFENVSALKRHFELEKPIVGGESGNMVVLNYPYSRDVDEHHLYTEVHHHAVTKMINTDTLATSDSDSTSTDNELLGDDSIHKRLAHITAVSSREGYLTKLGKIRKNWKVRWFVLRNTNLSYYKTKQSSKPIRIIDMAKATSIEYDNTIGKDFAFRIVLPERVFHLYANNAEDCDQWVELLSTKIATATTFTDTSTQV